MLPLVPAALALAAPADPPPDAVAPVWSPDGRQLAWELRDRGTTVGVARAGADRALPRPIRVYPEGISDLACRHTVTDPVWVGETLLVVGACISHPTLLYAGTSRLIPRDDRMVSQPRRVTDTRIAFVSGTSLLDYAAETRTVTTLLEGLSPGAQYDIAADGTVVMEREGPRGLDIVRISPDGREQLVAGEPEDEVRPQLVERGVLFGIPGPRGWTLALVRDGVRTVLATDVTPPTRGLGLSTDRSRVAWIPVDRPDRVVISSLDGARTVEIDLRQPGLADPALTLREGRWWLAYVADGPEAREVYLQEASFWPSAP